MTDAKDFALQFPQAGAERHVEPVQHGSSEDVGVVPVRHHHGGQRTAVFRGIQRDQLEAPRPYCAPGRFGVPAVPGKNIWQSLLMQHAKGLAQAVQQIGRRSVGEESGLVVLEHGLPIPVRPWEACRLRRRQRLSADGVEAEAGRQHEPLLGATHRYVHTPLIVPIVDGGQRRDGIHHEERRMSSLVDLPTYVRHPAGDARRGFVVHHGHRFDDAGPIFGELRQDHLGVDATTPIAGNEIHLETQPHRHVPPQRGEVAGLEHQDLVAWRQRIHQRRFPRAGSRRRVNHHRALRLEHSLKSLDRLAGDERERRPAVIDRRPRQDSQNAIGHVRGPGDLEKMAAALGTHQSPPLRSHRAHYDTPK